MIEKATWKPKWTIEKYDKDMKLYEVEEIEGNLLLNEGITEMLKLLIGDGTAVPFNNANTYIGVGDGNPTNLTGTVTFANGLTNVTGSGTLFTSEVAVGDYIGSARDGAIAKVKTINSNISITLDSVYLGEYDGAVTAVKIVGVNVAQTGLLGINKTYAPMRDSSYPSFGADGRSIIFVAMFGPNIGNHAWREFTVANGNSGTAKNLNRKVEARPRVKYSPDTWIVQLSVVIYDAEGGVS